MVYGVKVDDIADRGTATDVDKAHNRGSTSIDVFIPDRGCSLFTACLRCPFPRCRYDEGPRMDIATVRRIARDAKVVDLFKAQAGTQSQLAEAFNVSLKTVSRAITRKAG